MKAEDFKEFYKGSFRKAFGYIYGRVLSPQVTEDILAESYLGLFQAWEKIKDNNYQNYFYRILINNLNDYLKTKYDFIITGLNEENTAEIVDDSGKDLQTGDSKYKTLLMRQVQKLTDDDRKFFNLKYLQNNTYTEIAENLKISINNAKVINNRLVKKLKELCKAQI